MPRKPSPAELRRAQAIREWSRAPSTVEPILLPTSPLIAETIPAALKKIGLQDRWRHNQIADEWEEVVGVAIAKHAQPKYFQRDTLVIAVDHSTWLRELTHLKPQLLSKLRGRFGDDAPRDLVFRIG